MNSTTVYTEPTNRIKQGILFDDNLSNVVCLCENGRVLESKSGEFTS